jgi:hypothetical protein
MTLVACFARERELYDIQTRLHSKHMSAIQDLSPTMRAFRFGFEVPDRKSMGHGDTLTLWHRSSEKDERVVCEAYIREDGLANVFFFDASGKWQAPLRKAIFETDQATYQRCTLEAKTIADAMVERIRAAEGTPDYARVVTAARTRLALDCLAAEALQA